VRHSYRAVLVLALSAIFAFSNAAFINAVQPDSGTASTQSATKVISAKALADHECNTFEWHFIINGLANENQAPPTITVNFSNGNTVEVPHNKVNPNTAHYTTTTNLTSTVTSATAVIDASWAGNFNLSHGPCKPTPPPPPSLILNKVVINDNNGTMTPTAWTLSATAGVHVLSGTTPVTSGPGFQPGTYTLAESGPGGYTASSWVCTGTGTHSGSTITLAAGQSEVCTITNNDNPPALTISAPVVTPTPVTSATLTPVVIQSTPTPTPVQAQVVLPPTSGNVVTIPSTAQVAAPLVLLPPTSGTVVPVPAPAQASAPVVLLPPTSGNVVTVTKLPSTSTADEQSSTGAIGLAALVLGQALLMLLVVRRWRHE